MLSILVLRLKKAKESIKRQSTITMNKISDKCNNNGFDAIEF